MTPPNREELAGRLEELAALEPGWYANVGKRTGERCCQAMREAAAALRQSPSVEEVARVVDPEAWEYREHLRAIMTELGSTTGERQGDSYVARSLAKAQAIAALYGRGG